MSRIGKLSIEIPPKVEVSIQNQFICVSGPYGKAKREISSFILLKVENEKIWLQPRDHSRQARELHGLSRTLIYNMLMGVSTQFEQRLEIRGVGYRSQLQGKNLLLNLGYSHQVIVPIPENMEVSVEANVNLLIKGMDKEAVGQLAATIRSKRPPEPYKGKGILFKGEVIKRKVGKSGK